MLCAAPTYLERQGVPKTISELDAHDTVTYSRAGRVQSWILEYEGVAYDFNPVSRLRFDDIDAIADAAADGFVLAWLPFWLGRKRVETGELVPVMRQMPPHVSEVWAFVAGRPTPANPSSGGHRRSCEGVAEASIIFELRSNEGRHMPVIARSQMVRDRANVFIMDPVRE